MAKPLSEKISSCLSDANATTGVSDETLSEAVQTLIAGYSTGESYPETITKGTLSEVGTNYSSSSKKSTTPKYFSGLTPSYGDITLSDGTSGFMSYIQKSIGISTLHGFLLYLSTGYKYSSVGAQFIVYIPSSFVNSSGALYSDMKRDSAILEVSIASSNARICQPVINASEPTTDYYQNKDWFKVDLVGTTLTIVSTNTGFVEGGSYCLWAW